MNVDSGISSTPFEVDMQQWLSFMKLGSVVFFTIDVKVYTAVTCF
jgi:hypothetical protein